MSSTLRPFRGAREAKLFVLVLCLVVLACWLKVERSDNSAVQSSQRARDLARALAGTVDGIPFHPGRRPDEIPSIDEPVFAEVGESDPFLTPDDRVVGVHFGGVARAYPLWILGAREIVNDRMGGERICVTYCPLSASAVAFIARAEKQALTFGNAGALYECNLVLYDHQTLSLWYQMRAAAIAGALNKARLKTIPAHVVRWDDWRKRFPGSRVLVADGRTGRFFRALRDVDHEGLHSQQPAAPVSRFDPRLPVMQSVMGVSYASREICFLPDDFVHPTEGRISVPGMGELLSVRRTSGITAVSGPDGVELPVVQAYWFAWRAAFPQVTVVTNIAR